MRIVIDILAVIGGFVILTALGLAPFLYLAWRDQKRTEALEMLAPTGDFTDSIDVAESTSSGKSDEY